MSNFLDASAIVYSKNARTLNIAPVKCKEILFLFLLNKFKYRPFYYVANVNNAPFISSGALFI